MKSFFKFIFFAFVITVLIVAAALVAAPFFVRQEQVVSFIQENVELPEGKKLVLDEKIDFGFFPYTYLETKKIVIKEQSGAEDKFEDVKLGFAFQNLLSEALKFDFNVKKDGTPLEGSLEIVDYKSFLKENKSPIVLKISQPVPADVKGDLKLEGNVTEFSNFTVDHKKTSIKGSVKITEETNETQTIEGNVAMNSEDIDDLRRLAFFDQYSDEFSLLSGVGNIVLEFKTNGKDDYTLRRNLNSKGTIKAEDVVVYGIDPHEIANNPQVVKLTKDTSKKLNLDKLGTTINVVNGIFKTDNIEAQSEILSAKAKGEIDIADETILMSTDVDTVIASRKVKLPLLIRGDIRDPKIIPRIDQAVVNEINNLLEKKGIKVDGLKSEKSQKVISKAVQQIEGIGGSVGAGLKGFLGGASNVEPAAGGGQ